MIDVGLSWFNDNVSLSFFIGKNLFNYGRVQTISGPIDEIAHKYLLETMLVVNFGFKNLKMAKEKFKPEQALNAHIRKTSSAMGWPCFSMDQTNLNNLGRGCPMEHLCKIIYKSSQYFWTKRFLKSWPFYPFQLPQQPKFYLELNSLNNFKRGPPKKHSCQVILKSVHWFSRRSHL